MRIKNGIIYLVEPLFGRNFLTGDCLIMTNWLDYTFTEKLEAAELGLPHDSQPPAYVRVLIPLNNVRAVLTEQEEKPIYGLSLPPILQEV